MIGVVSFPGSTGDTAVIHALEHDLGLGVIRIDYRQTSLPEVSAIVLPGGATYGDSLRPGAIAARTPIMKSLKQSAEAGMPVLGIGNGFQILCEAGLLPGTLLQNRELKFMSQIIHIRVEDSKASAATGLNTGTVLQMPIAHGHGAYYINATGLSELKANGQIVARYCDEHGGDMEAPNGALESIAAVCNSDGNIVGMMPHPERATNALLGSIDGLKILGLLPH